MTTDSYPQTTFRIPPEEAKAVDDFLTLLRDATGRCPRKTCGATGATPCDTEDGAPHRERWTLLQDCCPIHERGFPARHGRAALICELLAGFVADPEASTAFLRAASDRGVPLRQAMSEAIAAAAGKRAAA